MVRAHLRADRGRVQKRDGADDHGGDKDGRPQQLADADQGDL